MSNVVIRNSKDTFIAMLTHDLKGPINSGIYALELLLSEGKCENLNDYQKELLNDILKTSKYIKNLTDNALCKFRAENGSYEIKKEYTSIKNIVKDCIKGINYLSKEKNQKINFICSKEDICANVDLIEIKRAIRNLISNACIYSYKNSEINVILKKYKDKVYFEVQDFGCGINLDKLSSVFDKYVRLANEQKSAGTGLGLYITKLIIDAHGGNIDIQSKKGCETRIFFEIPA